MRRSAALVREVSPSFDEALSSIFGGVKDPKKADFAHRRYLEELHKQHVELWVLPSSEEYPDSVFVQDTAIPLGRTIFIPRLKEKSRRGEVNDVRDFFSAQGYRIVYGKGFMDGGDVVFLGRNNYLVGLSERTNVKGAKSFVKIAEKLGFNVCLVQVPKTTLHLSTILSSPTPGTIVTAEGYLSTEDLLPLREYRTIWVPKEEAYAANLIGFPSGVVLIPSGYPVTRQKLTEEGFEVRELNMDAIRAADGSLTCCSIFYK